MCDLKAAILPLALFSPQLFKRRSGHSFLLFFLFQGHCEFLEIKWYNILQIKTQWRLFSILGWHISLWHYSSALLLIFCLWKSRNITLKSCICKRHWVPLPPRELNFCVIFRMFKEKIIYFKCTCIMWSMKEGTIKTETILVGEYSQGCWNL